LEAPQSNLLELSYSWRTGAGDRFGRLQAARTHQGWYPAPRPLAGGAG